MDRPRDPGAGAGPALRGRRDPARRRRSGRPARRLAGLRRRLRRWLHPPRTLRPTRAGWLFFALTLGVGFAALNTGNNLLYLVFSFLLAFLVLSGVLSEAALRRLAVRRRLPAELFAETPGSVLVEVENAQRLIPSFAIVVEDLAGEDVHEGVSLGRAFVLRLPPRGRQQRTYRLTAATRGRLRFAGFRISTRFPFGLFAKSLLLELPGETLVYPAIDALAPAALSGSSRRAGETRSRSLGRGTEAAGLRAWVPGDSARSIHWRASARRATLLVRDREREEKPEVEVLLRARGQRTGEAFEVAVRHAASEVIAHLEAGYRVGLSTESERLPPGEGRGHRAELLTFLALVTPDEEPRVAEAPARRAAGA